MKPTETMNGIDPIDQKAASELRSRLETIASVLDLRVFGSRSRGDAREDSDLDIFIRLETLDRPLREHIHDLAWEIGFEYDRVISTFVVTEDQIREGAVGASPLFAKVLEEGVTV